MNTKSLFAAALTTLALVFASGCAVDAQGPEVVVPDRPVPSPEPTHITKKVSTSEITMSAHDEASLLRLASVCERNPDTTYTITFRGTGDWQVADQERVVSILGSLANVKLVFQK